MNNEDIDSVAKVVDGNYRPFSLTDIGTVLDDPGDHKKPGPSENPDYPAPSYDEVIAFEGGIDNPALVTEL